MTAQVRGVAPVMAMAEALEAGGGLAQAGLVLASVAGALVALVVLDRFADGRRAVRADAATRR